MNKEKLASLQNYVSHLKGRLIGAPNPKNTNKIKQLNEWLAKEIKQAEVSIATLKEKV